MFIKTVVRSATAAGRSTTRQSSLPALRAFSTSLRSRSDHGAPPPQLFGPGSKPGEVPTDELQATGLERLQLLGDLAGVSVFDPSPLTSDRVGTKANPILVPSLDVERIIGCTGSPADSHNLEWFTVTQKRQSRCTECGSVYALDYQGATDHHEAHH